MDNRFQEDAHECAKQIIAVGDRDARPAGARRVAAPAFTYESNSYHGAAIKTAEQARLNKIYPRLYL